MTQNLCSKQPGKSNQTLCNNQTRTVRTWSVVISSSNFCSWFWTEQDPVGLLDAKAFLCSCFLFVGNRLHSASMTFREFQRARSYSCYSGKEGMQRHGRSSQETIVRDFPGGSVVKNPPSNAGDDGLVLGLPRWLSGKVGDPGSKPWVGKIPWRRKWQPTPAFLPGKSHEQRSLASYNPWDCKESNST